MYMRMGEWMPSAPALGRAIKLLSFGVLACLLGLVALVATATAPEFFGYHTYTVEGNSMAPALKRGSVAIAAPTSLRALRVGDIIAFRQSPKHPPVLHRIIEITNETGQLGFITQGDQNQTPDSQPVSLQGPGDKVMYSVPYAGYVLDFAHGTLGRILLIGLPLPTLLAVFLLPGKRAAKAKPESNPSPETQATRGEDPQDSPTRPAPRPSLEAQAFQPSLLSPSARRARRSLEAQALELGLLQARAPAQAEAEPGHRSQAA
jgi:signal peptidase